MREPCCVPNQLFRRDREPPIVWGPVERTAQAAAFATFMGLCALLTAAFSHVDAAGYIALACLALSVPTYLVTATIGTVRYEKRRRASR